MKRNILLSMLIIVSLGFSVACSFSETTLQTLANTEQREIIIKNIVLTPKYRAEMMDELMTNDSSKLYILQYLMHHKIMMNELFDLTAKDSIASRDLMAKTIEMCDGNSDKCKLLMQTMSLYPSVISYTNTTYSMVAPIN